MNSTPEKSKPEKNTRPKVGKKKKKKIIKIIIWVIVIIAVLLGACFYLAKGGNATAQAVLNTIGLGGNVASSEESYNTYTVSRRTIQEVLSGTGTLKPYDEYTVTALSSGEVVEDYFEEGDEVAEDQLLMKIDSENLESSLERAENNYNDAKDSLDDLYESREDLIIKSDYNGMIQVMNFEVGDDVRAGDVIASVIDRDTMLIDIPFMQSDTFNITKGMTAVLTAGDTLEEIYGTVDEISPSYKVNENGVKTVDVTIAVSNPGVITESTTATAKIGEYACTKASSFYYNVNETITAEIAGEVAQIVKEEGTWVSKGDTVLVLESESLDKSIEKAERSLKDALNSLEDAQDAFDNYEITAPISGTVVEKNFKKGEKIGSNNGGNTVAVIYDLSALKFDMNIDELDIDSLAVGQSVEITSDAKVGMTYTGEITKISVQGVTTNGTTYYPITVTLTDYGQNTDNALKPGMNIDAEIIIERAENVLAVPVDAVGRGNKVKVIKNSDTAKLNAKSDENKKSDEIPEMPENGEMPEMPDGMTLPENGEMPTLPEGAEMPENGDRNNSRPNAGNRSNGYSTVSKSAEYEEVVVETGISDESFIEIVSGLEEGDVVIVESSAAVSSGGFFGMMNSGMMGGGMPMGGGMSMGGGGMPGGGGGMPGGR